MSTLGNNKIFLSYCDSRNKGQMYFIPAFHESKETKKENKNNKKLQQIIK